ncbi:Ig-like domain-containing protein [Alloalcanivorax xenomutans]|uniref:Ig-like domain-containing protein n=1 Tax=Alloalcanivorax xenomutans TaxID=1094342 RepID=UPI001C537C99|nr:Ig-like domain-containing protein [Alloalcanivorax xenomutans]
MPGNDANDAQRQSLLYAYPDDGQAEVPTKAPVVLRFTSDVSLGDVEQSVTLCCDAEGGNLDYTAETVGPDPRGVILTPAQSLSPLTDYTIAIKNLRLRNGTSADRTLRFTTRPLAEGPRSLVVKDDGFAIDRQMPNGDTNEPIMDFSSFRFQFTQPVDRASARYGDTVVLTDSSGETVEATLLINGHYMTVDPKPEYLTPGQSYTLSLTNGLTSTFDEAFAGTEINFTPADSSPRGEPAMLVQRITQSGLSRLTGKNINQVPVNGTLLGEDVNVTQASADAVVAELADVTEYPDVTPIRLPRGTKLTGSAIEMVMIGGEVPAGFGSGPVDMRLTSDATGYLVPNPYNVHNRADALRIVHLLMDVGIATEDPRANGGFTQDIMHIELVGVAEVDTEAGVLNLDAVGMVEPNILGQEYGYGLLSFQLQSYKDQMNTPTAPEDTTGPTLQSWTLGTDTLTGEDKSLLAKPGDPIILNFDEPIDPQSVEGNVTLYKTVNGGTEEEMPAQVYVDGAAIVVKPEEDLQYSPEEAPVGYRLSINETVTDAAGNQLTTPLIKEFFMPSSVVHKNLAAKMPGGPSFARPEYAEYREIDHAPFILASYPGFPCAMQQEYLDDAGEGGTDIVRNLQEGISGLCAGAFPGIANGTEKDNKPQDDAIPVSELPSNRPILISFSEEMLDSSFLLGKTFKVEEISENEEVLSEVDGNLTINSTLLKFTPNKPWRKGALYRYTLKSSGYALCETLQGNGKTFRKIVTDPERQDATDCQQGSTRVVADHSDYECGEDTVCSKNGLPVQTQVLGNLIVQSVNPDGSPTGQEHDYVGLMSGPIPDAGGPDFIQFFRGTSPSETVLQILNSSPLSDTNHNFFSERSNIGNGLIPGLSVGEFLFPEEEYGPSNKADGQYPDYDPGGVQPSKNSAKVLSRFRNQDIEDRFIDTSQGIFGFNMGCSYFDENSPFECPEHKFTYLTSSIIAEVTNDIDDNGIIVELHPSIVAGTSIDLYALSNLVVGAPLAGIPGITGTQILRMRYGGTDRSAPITAWIKSDEGRLILETELDLYLDLPYTTEWGIGSATNGANTRSYPITMKISGDIHFMDDGRMAVEQFNTNDVDIIVEFHHPSEGYLGGYADLFIPKYGSRLNYISQPIK